MLDKQHLLWYNTDVVERLGNLFLVSLLEYSPEHDDKRLNEKWRCRLMVSQRSYKPFSSRLGQNQSSTLCAATMIKSNEVMI